MALIFNIEKNNFFSKKNLILSSALISTFSTAGYIALFGYLFLFATINKYKPVVRIFLALILLITCFFAYEKIPFVGSKISTQLSSIATVNTKYAARTRFVSALVDLE
ncbi:unnamed protein product, partial [marine sediment metagenome]